MWSYIQISSDSILNTGLCTVKFDLKVNPDANKRDVHFMNELIELTHFTRADRMARWVKTLAAEPGDLTLVSRTHAVKGEG